MSRAKSKRLGDIVNFKRGYDLPSYSREKGNYPIVSSGGITGYHSNFKVSGEGVVTGRYGTLGEVYYIKDNYWPHNTTLYVTSFNGNSPKYVYYLLKCLGNLKTSDKSTVPGINRNDLHEVRVPYLLPFDQGRLVSVLSALENKIEINNCINAKLEQIAKTLYDYWFVQFDFPNKDGQPYKSSGGTMLYDETYKRKVPEGWSIKKLGDIITKVNSTINSNEYPKLKYLPIDKLPKRSFSYFEYDDRENAQSSLLKFDKNDILLGAMRVYFHRVCLAFEDGISRNTIFSLRPNESSSRLFSLLLINKDETIQFANDNSTGSSIPYAKWENGLAEYLICMPPDNVREKFEKKLSPLFEKIYVNIQQNQQLSALRDWLLPMLMNGQVKVGEVRRPVESAMSMAAEPVAEYRKNGVKNGKTKQLDTFEKIQILYTTIWANKQINVKQGEMATAKDVYMLDRVYGVRTNFKFGQHNWGSFDPQEKQLFNTKQYFHKPKFPNSDAFYLDLKDNGQLLEKIPAELKHQISNGIKEMNQKIFQKFTGSKKAEKKELFATVLKCIEDTQSIDITRLRAEMRNWKIKQNGINTTKADKFSDPETRDALRVIIAEGWHKNVLA